MPTGSLCKAGRHLVASPEFSFLLVASDLRRICQEPLAHWQYVVILAELGCELCGTYSKQNTQRGFKNRDRSLTTSSALYLFACGAAHERGATMAYEALRWVLDGLNSPMETVAYLMLCLPRSWGGMGLRRPVSNYPLPVPEHWWSRIRERHLKPDLYWPEAGAAVEFFGKDFHEGEDRRDRERFEAEQDMGLKVVTFWAEDVLDLRKFNAKAEAIARNLGQELPEPSPGFQALQAKLLDTLMRKQRWI